jgi:hypothetical protein
MFRRKYGLTTFHIVNKSRLGFAFSPAVLCPLLYVTSENKWQHTMQFHTSSTKTKQASRHGNNGLHAVAYFIKNVKYLRVKS